MMRVFADRVWHPERASDCVEYDVVCIERDDGVVVDVFGAYVPPAFVDHYGDQHELGEPSASLWLHRDGDRYIVSSNDGSCASGFDRFERHTGDVPRQAVASTRFKVSDNAPFDEMPKGIAFDADAGLIWACDHSGARVHPIAPLAFFYGTRGRGVLMTTVVNAGLVTFGLDVAVDGRYDQPARSAALLRIDGRKHEPVEEPSLLRDLDAERLRRVRRYPNCAKLQPWRIDVIDARSA